MDQKQKIIAGVIVSIILLIAILGYGVYKSDKAIDQLNGSKWTEAVTDNEYTLTQGSDKKTYTVTFTPAAGGALPSGFTGSTLTVGWSGGLTYGGTAKGSRDAGTIKWSGTGAPGDWTLMT